jgi:hypothetical protein
VPATRADPLEGELARLHATPVKVRIAVVVHDDLVEHQPAWIDYVQRTVARASQIWQAQFGIELELVGVSRWSGVGEDATAGDLLGDVESRIDHRVGPTGPEEADILVGFTHRSFDSRLASQHAPPLPDGAEAWNGTAAVVYATPSHHDAHLRTLLFELGRLYGARPIEGPSDAAYLSGSWMSYAPTAETRPPSIDATNRARVLERKQKPFAPAASAEEDAE